MLDKFIGKLSIENLIRYILIGIVDVFLITLYFKLQKAPTSSQEWAIFEELTKQKMWLALIIPALGFTHYLLHRFFFFLIFDSFSYIVGTAPWVPRQQNENCIVRFCKVIALLDHSDKAAFVKFRNDWKDTYTTTTANTPQIINQTENVNTAPAANDNTNNNNRLIKPLSDYLFYRWAAIHYLFMILEASFVFIYYSKYGIWPIVIMSVVVLIYGAIPLHLYEKKYYEDSLINH